MVVRRSVGSRIAVSARRTVRSAAIGGLQLTAAGRPAPDFLIIGAQRCGTTSLFRALRAHPAVLGPVLKGKGVHYFDVAYTHPYEWYLAHFPTQLTRRLTAQRAGSRSVVGEASPYYLFHPAVPGRMAEAIPRARLIVMLRDPTVRAYSHYHHMRYERHEHAATFEEAIDREASELAGEEERLVADPGYVSPRHQHHSYLARGQYATQLRRVFAVFDLEQVLVLDSHRFFADPASGLIHTLDFLGVDPKRAPAMPALNAGRYPPLAAATLKRLEEHFAESNAALPGLLGWTPTWCR